MRRSLLTLFTFAVLAAWAGAQGPPAPLSAAVQVKQFKTNRILIENLVDHGIDLANAENPLQRAEECRKTARTLANYLERAADNDDPDRVAELASLFGEVVRDGLVPNLEAATREIRPGDPREPQLAKLRRQAGSDLSGVRAAIPATGKVAENEKVRAALQALDLLKGKFGP